MATNYDYYEYRPGTGEISTLVFSIIRTPISNIKNETILRPLSYTSYMGINGGFFKADDGYNAPPTSGASIVYAKEYENQTVTYQGRTLPKNYLWNETASNPISRKSAVIYKNSSNISQAGYMYAKNASEVFALYGTDNVEYIIGGNDFNLDSWGSIAYYLATYRTALSWKDGYAYLIVTSIGTCNIPALRMHLENMGLSPVDSIILDGSGSTQMQVAHDGMWKNIPLQNNRYIFNMIRLKLAY